MLLRGENGTGKGVLARTLHLHSRRHDFPFVMVNCPTLSEELLASEMFGHVKGSFTGAVRDQAGRVEAAEGGTLFLDEVGEISPALQAKLLRFLQERQFERIGETRTRQADVRVVAATNRNLEEDVADGRFREDLLYRLNVVEVVVPALRDRPEDILALARQFLAFFARAIGRPVPELAPATEQILRTYHWPGNVRQLRNAMERAVILWPSATIEPEACPSRCFRPTWACRRSAATLRSRTWNAGTSWPCWPARRRSKKPPIRWGSTRRPCGGNGNATRLRRRPRAHDSGADGSVNQKLLPSVGLLFTPIRPPCVSTTSLASGSPRPAAPDWAPGTRKKRSKIAF